MTSILNAAMNEMMVGLTDLPQPISPQVKALVVMRTHEIAGKEHLDAVKRASLAVLRCYRDHLLKELIHQPDLIPKEKLIELIELSV